MATKKDFSSIGAGKVSEAIETSTTDKKGQQVAASAEEIKARSETRETRGRKGCKLPRMNIALSPNNHDFVKVVGKATGRSMGDMIDDIITAYRTEHPEMEEKAKDFIDFLNSDAFTLKKSADD